ncbi:SLAP domain-containing protein [Lactobacillus crispatus]|uniref:S-layer protein n=1 Tax=Lactobacillus crispatus TaxID=47770 RepID=A0A854PLV2_9LACO|nr:SLAP domain-containing protein [Lactobacillus crispatus]OXC20312.1 hypothetical protein AYP81_06700 [Lactobacillus crispatus]OXC24521.1 hypothetical protein AYP82_00370 [Lactobacillus crispatus]
MKKNLRIVSAAAAALLAVAPVAASAVSVNAAAVTSVTDLKTVTLPANDAKVNITPNVSLTTSVPGTDIKAALSASFTATIDGTTATSTFEPSVSSVDMWYNTKDANGNDVRHNVEHVSDVTAAAAGTLFKVQLNQVSLNFGTKNANKDITLVLPNENGNHFGSDAKDVTYKTKTDSNGVAKIPYVVLGVHAKNFADPTVVAWLNGTTSAPVTAGNITLYAGSDAGKMNVAQVVVQARKNYVAMGAKVADPTNNIKEALKAMNIDVDAQGWFVAPKSFTFNLTAKSDVNDATATLPVTVNVPNGKDMTVPSQSKTVMHNAYFYDKNAKRVGTDKLTRYNSVTVAMSTTKIGDKTYYEVIENGKATGKFINADNIDGTKRTLKHNAYVYKTSKKRANKVTLKKGTEVTTYGGTYTFKNGKQYYKIGNNTDKTYVKASNF